MYNKHERKLKKKHKGLLAGIDEAGRGPWAGPVVASCVILPEKYRLPGLNDSKKMTHSQREILSEKIKKIAQVGIGVSSSAVIDKVGIKRANFLAMEQAVSQLLPQPEFLLIDGNDNYPFKISSEFVIKGDGKMACIAAASIVAKVERDRLMLEMDKKYPQYEFGKHKGYGTARHSELLQKFGPCDLHRKTYQPIVKIINEQLSLIS